MIYIDGVVNIIKYIRWSPQVLNRVSSRIFCLGGGGGGTPFDHTHFVGTAYVIVYSVLLANGS